MRLSCPEQMLGERDLTEKLRLITECGFDGLDVRYQTIADAGSRRLLGMGNLPIASVYSQIRTPSLLDSTALDRAQAVDDAVFRARATADVGASNMIMVPVFGPARIRVNASDIEIRNIERALLIAALHEIGERLANVPITVVLEPLNSEETHLLTDPVETANWCRLLGSLPVSTMVDTYHCFRESIDSAACVSAIQDRLALMHFSDSDRMLPGEGQVNFAAVVHALEAIDYGGWVGFECRQIVSDEDVAALRTSLTWVRSL